MLDRLARQEQPPGSFSARNTTLMAGLLGVLRGDPVTAGMEDQGLSAESLEVIHLADLDQVVTPVMDGHGAAHEPGDRAVDRPRRTVPRPGRRPSGYSADENSLLAVVVSPG
jgi:hypothetical protein